jgi:transmembrane sensor
MKGREGKMARQDRLTEAIQWHIRLRDGDAEAWEEFVRWLEEDPERSAVYDAVAHADAALRPDMIPAALSLPAANDDWMPDQAGKGRRARRGWMTAFASVAALFLLVLIAFPWLNAGSGRYEIATAPGQRRTVAIEKGSSIAMNGASRIALDRDNPRFAELLSGEAAFTVRHDGARPFTVVAGDHRVQDVGTVFNLVRDGGLFSVEVAEGAILFDPGGAALSLGTGETLAVRESGGPAVRGRKDPGAVAGWRHGQLSYKQAPLAAVARDLSRSIGMEIRLDPAIAERPFTGSIRIDGDPSVTMGRLAATLDMEARHTGAGWLIEPPQRARR